MTNHDSSSGSRPLLKDRAYTRLKRRLLSGAIAPGSFLSERRLAQELKMSKTPVRAAIARLELEGFVSISPQQGIVVRDLTLQEIVDHFDIREALETFVARSIAGQLSARESARLRANLKEQQQSVEEDDRMLCTRLDTEFHMLLCEFAGNREITRTMQQLRDKLYRVILTIYAHHAARLQTSYEEHLSIAEAIIDGEQEQATRRLEQHLRYGKQLLVTR